MSGLSTKECERYLFAGSRGWSILNEPPPLVRFASHVQIAGEITVAGAGDVEHAIRTGVSVENGSARGGRKQTSDTRRLRTGGVAYLSDSDDARAGRLAPHSGSLLGGAIADRCRLLGNDVQWDAAPNGLPSAASHLALLLALYNVGLLPNYRNQFKDLGPITQHVFAR
jgi:hypothetical protein